MNFKILFTLTIATASVFALPVLAEETNSLVPAEVIITDSLNSESASIAPATGEVDFNSRLQMIEQQAPVILKLASYNNLVSGAQIEVKANVGFMGPADVSTLDFKWFLRKDGLDQSIFASKSGKGKDVFNFLPTVAGDYEVKVQVTNIAGVIKESEFLKIPVGENLLLAFEPLKPTKGQRISVSVAGFNNTSNYEWYLDNEKQESVAGDSSRFEFLVNKNFEQNYKVKVIASNGGRISQKEISIPIYRPSVSLQIEDNSNSVFQAGITKRYLIKEDAVITIRVDIDNFQDSKSLNYQWVVNGKEFESGLGKNKITILGKTEKSNGETENIYRVGVLVNSSGLKDTASDQIILERIGQSSSLAAIEPERTAGRPLLAESKSFFTSFETLRKIAMPAMVLMFVILIMLSWTQPEKIE